MTCLPCRIKTLFTQSLCPCLVKLLLTGAHMRNCYYTECLLIVFPTLIDTANFKSALVFYVKRWERGPPAYFPDRINRKINNIYMWPHLYGFWISSHILWFLVLFILCRGGVYRIKVKWAKRDFPSIPHDGSEIINSVCVQILKGSNCICVCITLGESSASTSFAGILKVAAARLKIWLNLPAH